MQEHWIVLGRQPELSLAELVAASTTAGFTVSSVGEEVAALHGDGFDEVAFDRLGGAVKLAVPIVDHPTNTLDDDAVVERLVQEFHTGGKATFGCSVYGRIPDPGKPAFALAQALKRALKERSINTRFVRDTTGHLSSVVVGSQLLGDNAAEFICVRQKKGWRIGKTIAVQKYEAFSKRDYGRPARNTKSGMLPPKLARMMVNIASVQQDAVILDPFCGSGTILQEAALLGYTHLTGVDASAQAVAETQKNLAWATTQKIQVVQADVRTLTKSITPGSVSAIVCEPYLGPPLLGREAYRQLDATMTELSLLYRDSFGIFAKLLRTGGTVVFLFPVFQHKEAHIVFRGLDGILAQGFRLRPALPPELAELYVHRLTERGTIVYRRPGQHVGREVVVFQKS